MPAPNYGNCAAPTVHGFLLLRFNGKAYNVVAPGHADELVSDNFDTLVSFLLEKVQKAREDDGADAKDRGVLFGYPDAVYQNYQLLAITACQCSLEVFDMIPESELKLLMEEMKRVFARNIASQPYIEQGSLQKSDQELLSILCSMMDHYKFAALVLKDCSDTDNYCDAGGADGSGDWQRMSLLGILAQLLAARPRNNLPSADICNRMIRSVRNVVATLDRFWFLNPGLQCICQDRDELFQKLENSGLLVQVFRCMTMSPDAMQADNVQNAMIILESLLPCDNLIRNKFKVGEKSGDVLRAINSKRDGSPGLRTEEIETYLAMLERKAMELNDQTEQALARSHCHVCSVSIHELGSDLLRCSQCQSTFYCSKKCQKRDWKLHKRTCRPPGA